MDQRRMSDLIAGAALKRAASRLFGEVETRVKSHQGGVPTFHDNFVLRTVSQLRQLDFSRPWEESSQALGGLEGERLRHRLLRLRRYLTRREAGRLVELAERRRLMAVGAFPRSDIDGTTMAMSQGSGSCLSWKGLPLFKTAFDFALYPMILWEVKPRTVIELGSGSGASAIWLADQLKLFELDSRVLSLDLHVPELAHEAVTFISGNCERITEDLPADLLSACPHPWVVFEDAHVQVLDVLSHLHDFLEPGDYLVVEDSTIKVEALDAFVQRFPGCYLVDTYFTDFFGCNATSCFDSIFTRA